MKEINLSELKTKAIIGDGVIPRLPDFIDKNAKVALIYSKNINVQTEKRLINSLSERDLYSFKLSDGEAVKSVEWACLITEFLAVNRFNRGDVIVAAGGGTVCDLCGFIASVYMRGIKYINVPTTLLCAVDACIGGKTAIDIPRVKNGWGSFYQPVATIVDVNVMSSLQGEAFYGGVSEIVKYAAISPEFFDYLDTFSSADDLRTDLENVIYKCLKIKADFVLSDERDLGTRKKLNAGHTVAHAIEEQSGYKITHGEAVAKGLFAESSLSRDLNLLSESEFNRIISALTKFISGFSAQSDLNSLISYMRLDKKNAATGITFALPVSGGVNIYSFSEEELKNAFSLSE